MKNIFAHQLGKLRTEQQLSQNDIASQLFVSRQAVSKWENGDTEPSLDNLISLAQLFNVSLDNLVTGSKDPNTLLLTVNHLKKFFNKPVLKDITFSISNYERIALLGSNGAGKSTLIKILIGLLNPDSGKIKYHFNLQQDLNVMPQDDVLIPDLTVMEQVKLAALINKVYQPKYINNLLVKFKLNDQANQFIQKLSGGQKRRLSLLVSTLRPAKLLILDEPTNHLDLESIQALNQGLINFKENILFTSHDHQFVQTTANRIMEILPNGTMIDKITTYDEYLASDEMAKKRHVFEINEEDASDN